MKNHFDEWAEEYNVGIEKLPYWEQWIFNQILKEINPKKSCTIVDLGTGDARILLRTGKKYPFSSAKSWFIISG